MKIHFRRSPSGMLLVALFFLVSGCGSADQAEHTPEALYKQASTFSRSKEYLKALDCYNRAIALDTLQVNSPRVVEALLEKCRLEGLTGEYYAALKTTARLEKLPLPDSLRAGLFSDEATLLCELGNFKAAAAALEKIASPSQKHRFELANLCRESGDYAKAATIYHPYTALEYDPVTRIMAFAGLLQCTVAQPEPGTESAESIAAKIAAESKRVFASDAALVPQIQAIRTAAKSLLLLEKQQRNGSYLLFRALMLAEEAQNQPLIQLLRLESNAVIVRKADAFREAADYFRVTTLQYAQATSLFMLASSKSLSAEERVAALQQGFALSRDFAPPYPTNEHLQIEKSAGHRLTALLLEQSRIFELFDAEEKIGTLELKRTLQRYPNSFVLGKGHEALEAKIRRLQHETAGLLQRKVNIFSQAKGVETSRQVDQALNIKRGKMLELLAEVRAINPVAAEAIQFIPVTLRTVQEVLKEGQLIIKPLLSDSLCGIMLIGKRQLQITGSPLSFDAEHTPGSAVLSLRSELASGALSLTTGSEQAWFTSSFYEPLAGSINGFSHLVVIADDFLPYHILGNSSFSVSAQRYSFLPSLKEFVLLSGKDKQLPVSSRISFYRVDNLSGARLHKLFAPRDRVFLLWKNFNANEINRLDKKIGQEMQGTVSGSEGLSMLRKSAETEKDLWMYISSYGVD